MPRSDFAEIETGRGRKPGRGTNKTEIQRQIVNVFGQHLVAYCNVESARQQNTRQILIPGRLVTAIAREI